MSFATLVAVVVATASTAQPTPAPGYADLQGLFRSIIGQHVVLGSGRETRDLAVDTVGSDLFCGRTNRETLCVPFDAVLSVRVGAPGEHRVTLRADALPAR
jgi:hypothetical protein